MSRTTLVTLGSTTGATHCGDCRRIAVDICMPYARQLSRHHAMGYRRVAECIDAERALRDLLNAARREGAQIAMAQLVGYEADAEAIDAALAQREAEHG